MKFEKIIIPPGWKDTFTKYPNGRTIFEALSHTITTVNEGIKEVNQKVNQGLLAIEQAENTIRQEITESFNTLKLQLEGEVDDLSSDLIADFALLQSDVLTLIAGKADKTYVDAQLAEIENQMADVVKYEVSLNKFNKNDTSNLIGKIIGYTTVETISDNALYGVTHFVEIVGNKRLYINTTGFITNVYYDENKVAIGRSLYNLFTPPANARYIRCNYLLTEADNLMIYDYYGFLTEYEPYKLKPVLSDKLVLPIDSLSRYREACNNLINGEDKIYNICVLGDSITEGAVAGTNNFDYMNLGYMGLLKDRLYAKYGDNGEGLIPTYYKVPQFLWTFSDGWTDETLVGVTGRSKHTNLAEKTATIGFNGTGLAIIAYTHNTYGRVGVSIDGGAETILNFSEVLAGYKTYKIEGLSDGQHTAVIRTLDNKSVVLVGYYELKPSTKGFRVNFCGRSGIAVTSFTSVYGLQAEIDLWQPKLTIIASITNDIGSSIPVADYRTHLQILVDRAKIYGDVILFANNGRIDKTKAVQLPYVNAMRDIAFKNNCIFVDMFNRWQFESHNMGYMADTLHMTATGHKEMADALTPYVIL